MDRQMAGAAVGAVVSSFLRPLADEAARLAKEEIALLWGVDQEVAKLSRTLRSICSVLDCAEQRELGDQRVRDWMERLRDVALDADDVLDEFATDAAVRSSPAQARPAGGRRAGGASGCLSACFTCARTAPFRHEIGRRIKEIRERLGEIDDDHKKLGLLGGTSASSAAADATNVRETFSTTEDHFVGREKEKEEIIRQLLGSDGQPEEESRGCSVQNGGDGGDTASLVPIVGMGGIGKTALAQAVFNDKKVEESFPFRKWVYVGEKFDAKKVMRVITDAGGDHSSSTVEDLRRSLTLKLQQERSLIVLDDVWSESHDEWRQILPPTSCDGQALRWAIVFTARSQKVANAAGAAAPDSPLPGLPEADCWRIFEKRAFHGSAIRRRADLERVGRMIVGRLNGVPLAVMAVAGFLRGVPEESRWRSVLGSIAHPLADDILPILRLSYQHLPPHLKRCFAYCSVFPKGYLFHGAVLAQMWIAQSYVDHPRRGARLEDTAAIYFADLHSRSFFQRTADGYQMHDLMHDLAQSVSNDESRCRLTTADDGGSAAGNPNNHRVVLHVSFSNDPGLMEFEGLYQFERTRSLLYLHEPSSATFNNMPRPLFDHLRCIRVLCLSYCEMKELPDSFAGLKHLRYLDLSFTRIWTLPESLCGLWNLQTLRILDSVLTMVLVELPKGMTKLVNLRCLDLNQDLVAGIAGIGRLSSLQELKVFYVRKEDGYGIAELKGLSQLGGGLCISNLENVGSRTEAALACLKNKPYLHELGLEWSGEWAAGPRSKELETEVLEGLQPPPNLKTLRISNNGGVHPPTWMRTQLISNLESIALHGCRNWLSLPPLGRLQFLKALKITGAEGVRRVGQEFYGDAGGEATVFPALEDLEMFEMWGWEEWVGGEDEEAKTALFPALRRLKLGNCPQLRGLPMLPPSLVELNLMKLGLRTLPGISSRSHHVGSSGASSSNLLKLEIQLCPDLESIPGSLLQSQSSSLEELEIRSCGELASMPIQSVDFRCLKNLTIVGCPKLALQEEEEGPSSPSPSSSTTSSVFLPSLELLTTDNSTVLRRLLRREGHPSLQNLVIRDSSYVPAELRRLPALSILTLMDCPQVRSLPELEPEHLPRLGRLWVAGCPQLEFLPLLHGLSQLTKLCVQNCPRIQSLPEGRLPATVEQVMIKACPALKERCRPESGPDWPKIAHVPNIL